MPAQFTLPPDTRSVGTGNPPADVNAIVDGMAALGAGSNVLNAAYAGGADPTGAADSTAAVTAAVAALPAAGGVIYFPAGTYKIASTVTIAKPGVYLAGAGMLATVINYTGSGDCIRMYSVNQYTSGWGGGIRDLTIDGSGAAAGACGIHAGDIYQLQWNVGVRLFQGAGSKGIWFDNQYWWAEDMYGHVLVQQNSTNIVFDNSANLTGQATGSFARTVLTVVMDAKGVGDGVVLKNAAQVYASEFIFVGNMDYSSSATKHWALTIAAPAGFSYTATNASPCVFTAAGHYYGNGANVFLTGGSPPTGFTNGTSYYVVNTNIGAGTFQLAATLNGTPINSTSTGNGTVNTFTPSRLEGRLNINVECNAVNANPQPGTINFTSASSTTGYNSINHAAGVIDFSQTSVGFATAVNATTNFFFDGPVYGDIGLFRSNGLGASAYFNGSLASSTSIYTQGVARSVVNTTTPLTGMIMANGPALETQLVTVENNGTGSITFAASGTSHVKNGTSCLIPPNAGMMFSWRPDQGFWYPLTDGPVSGGLLAAPQVYAPGSQTAKAVTTTTMAAFDTTNITTPSFTAPSSGKVLVTVSFVGNTALGNFVAFGLAAHSTVTPLVGNLIESQVPTADALPYTLQFYVSGLTAGTAYQFDLLGCVTAAGTFTISAFGQTATSPTLSAAAVGSPVILSVQAV